jgi:hypothetical protein
MTPEITEILNMLNMRYRNWPDHLLSNFGITDRAQLDNLHFGKPIPVYLLNPDTEILVFSSSWEIPVLSDSEPLNVAIIGESDGQYRYSGNEGSGMAKILHNYEHKDSIIGHFRVPSSGYLIIRKDNKVIFVQVLEDARGERFKEISFNEIINLLKK